MGGDKSWIGSLIGAAGSMMSGGMGSLFQKRQNEKQREYEYMMYQEQVDDAERFWRMENQYNSPEMQMQRLKQAGLNPNLVYGNGANAQGGNISAPKATTSDLRNMQNPAAGLDQLGSNFMAMYDMRQKDAQTNLLKEQVETQRTIQELNAVNALRAGILKEKDQVETNFQKASADTRLKSLENTEKLILSDINLRRSQTRQSNAQIDLIKNQTQKTIDDNLRLWSENKINLKQMAANVLKTQAETRGIDQNTKLTFSKDVTENIMHELHALDVALAEKGMNRNDPATQRIIKDVWDQLTEGKGVKQVFDWAKGQLIWNKFRKK